MSKFVRRIVRQKKQQERVSFRYFNSIFRSSIDNLVARFDGDTSKLIASTQSVLFQYTESVESKVKQTWGNCGRVFALDSRYDTIANSKQIRGLRGKDISDEVWQSSFEQNAINFISQNSLEKAQQILKTNNSLIVNKLESLLATSIEEGLSIDNISSLIGEDFKKWGYDISKKRARVIARTEVNSAANYAQMNGAESLGVPLEKKWSTSGLSNIRHSHVACEAQGWIDYSLKFVNGLRFPGDQSTGDVGEFVNCRCTAQFRAKLA